MLKTLIALASLTIATSAFADVTVSMTATTDKDPTQSAGTVTVSQTKYGLLFTPHLQGLTPGIHGFHVHEKSDCGDHAMAAGGHLDPMKTSKHLGPFNDAGHLGDLPALYVNADGSATLPVLAPRLTKLAQINNHALMIHNGGDNYSDQPEKLGGGDGRMFCGIIK